MLLGMLLKDWVTPTRLLTQARLSFFHQFFATIRSL